MTDSPNLPTIDQFAEVLSQEADWYTLGTFLSVPQHELEWIHRTYGTEKVARCLIALYQCLQSREMPLSWDSVAEALNRMNNKKLANKIYSDHILPFQQSELFTAAHDQYNNEEELSSCDSDNDEPTSVADDLNTTAFNVTKTISGESMPLGTPGEIMKICSVLLVDAVKPCLVKVTNELNSNKLLTSAEVNNILTARGVSDYKKSSQLILQLRIYLTVFAVDSEEYLIKICKVFVRQKHQPLTEIATFMLQYLG